MEMRYFVYPSEAIIVTFDNIPLHRNRNMKFKYQLIIATDYTDTVAVFNYERLDTAGSYIGFSDRACHFVSKRYSNIGAPGKHIIMLTQQECIDKLCKFRKYYMKYFNLSLIFSY